MAAQRPRVEVLTPRGAGGVAVLRIAGQASQAQVAGWLRSRRGERFERLQTAPPRLAVLCPADEALDEVLVVERPGPALMELHLHGSEAVLESLGEYAELVTADTTPAEDLLSAARSDAQLELALEQTREQAGGFGQRLAVQAALGAAALLAVKQRTESAQALVEPARLVLCGAQNAGKSTLMNGLLFRERVLCGELPGLTRDPVREITTLCGYPYELVDTAGEGVVALELDGAALALGRLERQVGLRLLVVDGNRGLTDEDAALHNSDTLVVRTKADLSQAEWGTDIGPSVRVSCADSARSGEVRTVVGEALRQLRQLPLAGPVGGLCALDAAQRAELEDVLAAR